MPNDSELDRTLLWVVEALETEAKNQFYRAHNRIGFTEPHISEAIGNALLRISQELTDKTRDELLKRVP